MRAWPKPGCASTSVSIAHLVEFAKGRRGGTIVEIQECRRKGFETSPLTVYLNRYFTTGVSGKDCTLRNETDDVVQVPDSDEKAESDPSPTTHGAREGRKRQSDEELPETKVAKNSKVVSERLSQFDMIWFSWCPVGIREASNRAETFPDGLFHIHEGNAQKAEV